jgi:arginyl-tRNA synthetase
MELLDTTLSDWMTGVFASCFPDNDLESVEIAVVATTVEGFGDYQCNAAMGLARVLQQNPRRIAESVVNSGADHEAVEKLEIAGPGFINIYLNTGWIAAQIVAMGGDPRLGVPVPGEGQRVVMDYGAPNIAKPLHIGHLRSHNIGSAIDRMLRFIGYEVVADNHLGDWGTQFGITIMGWRESGDAEALEQSPMAELERLYVESYEKTKTDEDWLTCCRQELVKLQAGDEENTALWRRFVELSLKELERIYARLGIRYDLSRGESFYNDQLPDTVSDLEARGLARPSEGAIVVFLEEEGLPACIVRKSDGGFNYATTDIATVRSRVEQLAASRIIYVTDERQQLHFKQVFAIAARLGYTASLEHVWFGLMRLPEGAFSTREGNVIRLDALLDEAEERARAVVAESSPDIPPDQQDEIARMVGIGAVKYADLSQNPQSAVTFTWEKALALNGNSGPYLQYACARISSVLDKYAERHPAVSLAEYPVILGESVERKLAVHLLQFAGIVIQAGENFRPNVLADYLYELAGMYSTFYQNVPFLRADEGVRESRVRLCGIVADVLRQGLSLLGIETPKRI